MLSWKRIGRKRWVQVALGTLAAEYLRLVYKTTRAVIDPPDGYARIDANLPVILAMWHGQHFMGPFMQRPGDRAFAAPPVSNESHYHQGILTAEIARRITSRITSTGEGLSVKSSNCFAACRTNMSTPVVTALPG